MAADSVSTVLNGARGGPSGRRLVVVEVVDVVDGIGEKNRRREGEVGIGGLVRSRSGWKPETQAMQIVFF